MKIDTLLRPSRAIADFLVLAIGWWLIVLSVFTCIEMVSRKLFRFSFQGIDEVGGYTLAIASAIGFSYTLLARGHTRVDFLIQRLPEGLKAALNWLAMFSLATAISSPPSTGVSFASLSRPMSKAGTTRPGKAPAPCRASHQKPALLAICSRPKAISARARPSLSISRPPARPARKKAATTAPV